MADAVRDRTGQQLGNYRLLRLLRHESTVDVYLGEHIFLKTQAAIRVLPGQLSQDTLEAFLADTRNIARMKHSNILRILEFGVEDKTAFLVTDYTPNGSLRQRHPGGTPVPSAEIVSYVKQVAAALQYIHSQGMVHRGVRPENMLIGSQNRILLSDFSPVIEALDEAPTRKFSGEERAEELKYMAPEQLLGQPGPASDQYALGVVVYEWLSGDTPFHGSMSEIREQHSVPVPLRTKVPAIPPELEQLLRTALEQDPGKRFASVAAFAHALEQILPPPQLFPRENGQAISEMLTMPLPAKSYTGHTVAKRIGLISFILLVLLIIGGSLLYNTGIFASSRQKTPTITHAQTTQTVVARGMQQTVATFTAQSPQEIYAMATRGKPFFNDPLKDGSGHVWDNWRLVRASCGFSNEVYQVQIVGGNYFTSCLASTINAHNFAYEVQMRLVKGGAGGLVFRSNHSGSSFYTFQAENADGENFNFSVYKNNEVQAIIDTSNIYNLQNFNTYTVIAYENNFYFYINKTFLVVSQDNTLTTGAIGVYARNLGAGATSVEFRDAKVWKL
jgi:eukaryotic-like serine/threonine-protein kinase